MTHTITILGSTGSIGRQTLSVAEELGLRVAALTAEKNVDLLEAQCRKYRPELAVMTENAAAEELKTRLADMNIRVLAGSEALCEAAALPQADTVVAAVSGFAALRPTLTAIREKKRIALANKETMVCAGQLMQAAARASGRARERSCAYPGVSTSSERKSARSSAAADVSVPLNFASPPAFRSGSKRSAIFCAAEYFP